MGIRLAVAPARLFLHGGALATTMLAHPKADGVNKGRAIVRSTFSGNRHIPTCVVTATFCIAGALLISGCGRSDNAETKKITTTTFEVVFDEPTTTTVPVYPMQVASPPQQGFTITSCRAEGMEFSDQTVLVANGTATNPYGATSTGHIEIIWESADGAMQYGTTYDLAQDLLPNQSAALTRLEVYVDTPVTGGRCRISDPYWYDPATYDRR